MEELINNTMDMRLYPGEGFLMLVSRFLLHILFLVIIVRGLYYNVSKRRDFLFTYLLVSVSVFILCFMLQNVKIELGFALGLFAVFGIIQYRTNQMPIREMTYLFIVISLAVINAVANSTLSFAELIFANGVIYLFAWILERVWAIKHISRKVVQYDNIKLILPEKRVELIKDLEKRLGLKIINVEIGNVDFLHDSAKLAIFYYPENKRSNSADDIEQYQSNGRED
jgi:hypothetical protein